MEIMVGFWVTTQTCKRIQNAPPPKEKDLITTLGNLEEYREVHFLDPLGGVGSFSNPSASEVFSIKPVLTGTGTIR